MDSIGPLAYFHHRGRGLLLYAKKIEMADEKHEIEARASVGMSSKNAALILRRAEGALNLSARYIMEHRNDEAREMIDRALEEFQQIDDVHGSQRARAGIAAAYYNRCVVAEQEQQLDEAAVNLRTATDLSRRGRSDSDAPSLVWVALDVALPIQRHTMGLNLRNKPDDPEIVAGMRRLAPLREPDAAGPSGLDTDDMSDISPLAPTRDEQY